MKKLIALLMIASFFITDGYAQEQAPAKRFPIIPQFTLLGVDSSSIITKANLADNKKTMIMYFSPDCDHCQHQTEALLKSIDRFKGVQIVMATYQPFEEMTAFYKKYNIGTYPQIHLGRDTKFFFVPFYQIRDLPYIALYDAKGNLIKTFESTTDIGKLAGAFEKSAKKKG